MNKLAIFVEGQTEQIFIEKLLIEIAGKKNISIQKEKAIKNKLGQRIFSVIEGQSKVSQEEFYVLIRDCGSDGKVKSDILDHCQSLGKSGYSRIIGLRDVYPLTDIDKLKKYLEYGIPIKFIPITIHLAVMELEAWFIAETTHFLKIHPNLTNIRIKKDIGYDPATIDIETIGWPARDLDKIYKLEGLFYRKKKVEVQRTVEALNYSEIYINLRSRVKSINNFINELDVFFTK